MRRILVIALVGLILISLLEWGINTEISHYQTYNQTNQYQSSAFSGPVFLGLKDELAIAWDWIGRNHTELLVIFTASLFVVTGFLVRYTKKLWGSTAKSVDDAKDTAQKELRAYLGAANGTLYFILNSNHLRAAIELRNSGQTPAQKVSYAIDGAIRLPDDKTPFKELVSGQRNQPIAPGSAWTVGHEFLNLSDADKQDILSDKKYVFIWGRADYFDIFGKPQMVKFRYRNVVKNLIPLDGGQTGIQNWFFYPEEEGNEAT